MEIKTDPVIITKEQLLKKKKAAQLGIKIFQKEVSEIETMDQSELDEAKRILSLISKLKKSKKLLSKKKAVEYQKQKLKDINKGLSDMEDAGVDQLII